MTERTVLVPLKSGDIDLRTHQPERQVSVPWCTLHDSQPTSAAPGFCYWWFTNDDDEECVIEDGVVWRQSNE